MPRLYELCSKCGNNFYACNCDNYHPPLKTVELEEGDVVLNSHEVKLLIHFLRNFGIESNHPLRALAEKLTKGRT